MSYSEEERSWILGWLIHDERKRRRKSAEAISALSGISQQYLSEVERGRKTVTPYSMSTVLAALEIPFSEDLSLVERAEQILGRIVDAYLRFDRESLESSVSELLSGDYRFSYAYPHYLSGKLVRERLLERKAGEPSDLVLPNLFYADRRRNMLDCLCVEKGLPEERTEDREAILQKGLSFYEPYHASWETEALCGILLFDLSDVYEAQGRLWDALERKQRALDKTAPHYYAAFALSIELGIAALQSKLGQFCQSTQRCLRIINSAEGLQNPNLRRAAVFNLAENHLVAGRNRECIDTAAELEPLAPEDDRFLPVYFLLSFAHFEQGEDALAKEYGRRLLERADPDSVCFRMTSALLDILDGKWDGSGARVLFREILQKGDPGDAAILYRLLSEWLKTAGRYEDALACSEDYISYLFRESRL